MDENSDNSSAITRAEESGLPLEDRCAIGSGAGQLNNHGIRSSLRLRLKSDGASTATDEGEGTLRLLVPLPSIPSGHDATGTTGAVAARPAPAPGNAVPSLSSQQSRDLDSAAVAHQNENVEMDEASGDAVGAVGSAKSESEDHVENGADGEEMWDLKMVLMAGQITGPNAMECLTVDPRRCDELRQAMLDKCTRETGPSVPGGVPPSMATANAAAGVDAAAAVQGGLRRSGRKKTKSAQALESEAAEADAASVEESDAGDGDASEGDDGAGDGEGEGDWELKKIFDVKELGKARPKMCQTELCDLQACSKWVAQHDTENPWFSCVDCQEKDYQGWPTDPEELPIKHLTEENRAMIVERCSKQNKEPVMPDLPTALVGKKRKGVSGAKKMPPKKKKESSSKWDLPLSQQTFGGIRIFEMPKTKEAFPDSVILEMGNAELKAVKSHVGLVEVSQQGSKKAMIEHIQQWRRGEREATGSDMSEVLARESKVGGYRDLFFKASEKYFIGMEPGRFGIPAAPDGISSTPLDLIAYELGLDVKDLMGKIRQWNFVRDPRSKRDRRECQVFYHPDFDSENPIAQLRKLDDKGKKAAVARFYKG